jgi:hypothetical protein
MTAEVQSMSRQERHRGASGASDAIWNGKSGHKFERRTTAYPWDVL